MKRSAWGGGRRDGVKSWGWTGSWEKGRGHQITRGAMVGKDRGRGRDKGVVGSIGPSMHSVAHSCIPSSMLCSQALLISRDHHISQNEINKILFVT